MTLDEAKEVISGWVDNIIGEWYSRDNDNGMGAELEKVLAAIDGKTPWFPPPIAERPDGFECLIWHRGRWRHVKWVSHYKAWALGYATAQIPGDLGRMFAPLPWNTPPDNDFWEGKKS